MSGQATVAKLNIMLGVNTEPIAQDINSKALPTLEGFKEKVHSMSEGGFAHGLTDGAKELKEHFHQAGQAIHAMEGGLHGIGSSMASMSATGAAIAAAFIAIKEGYEFLKYGFDLAFEGSEEAKQSWTALKDRFAQLAETVGQALVPVFRIVVNVLTDMVRWLQVAVDLAGKAFKWLGITDAIENLAKLAERQREVGGQVDQMFGGVRSSLGLAPEINPTAMKAAAEANKKLMEEQAKMAAQITKEYETQARLMTDAINRQNEGWTRMGQSVTEAMRTPAEILNQQVGELNFLANRGLITFETYSRAINKAADDFAGMGEKAKQYQRASNPQVAAVDRYTTAGFSAVREGQAVWEGIRKLEEEQLQEEKEANSKREKIIEILKRGGLKVKEVTF